MADSRQNPSGSNRRGPKRDHGHGARSHSGARGSDKPRSQGGRPDRGRPDRGGSDQKDRPRRTADQDRTERGQAGRRRSEGDRPGGDRRRADQGTTNRRRSDERGVDGRRSDRPRREDTQPEPVFPPVDADVEPKQLDRIARRELSGLDKEDAEFVAGHLVMAGRLVESHPEAAHAHAKAALYKGSRIPVVRETLGITAYLTGDFALALRELRTHRRLSGSHANVPMMVDCERGVNRPDRAIELARSVDPSTLDTSARVELAIALSGARLDQGQPDRALLELQIPELNPDVAYSYSPALFDAYAVVLEDLGRTEEAAQWGRRADVAAAALAEAEGQGDDFVEIEESEDPKAPEVLDEPGEESG